MRSTLGVFDMELENVHFDYSVLEKNTDDYYQGRKKWLKQIDEAKWVKALPFERIQNKTNNVDGYRIGFEYDLSGVRQLQYSYYLICDHRMFHLKTISPQDGGESDEQKLTQIISTFSCARDPKKIGGFDTATVSENWKKVNQTPEKRLAAVRALQDFLVEYEQSHQAAANHSNDDQSRIETIKRFFDRFLTPTDAFAGDKGCFFAGWTSAWGKNPQGKWTCSEPDGAKGCGDDQIKCNPAVFGNVCILSTFKDSATQVCNSEYKNHQVDHDKEISKYLNDNPTVLPQLAQSAEGICGEDPYRNANYGLCSTLNDRIAQSANGDPAALAKLPPPPNGIDPTEYEKAKDVNQGILQLIENYCLNDDKKTMRPSAEIDVNGKKTVIDCVALKDQALANLKSLEKVNSKAKIEAVENSCPLDSDNNPITSDTLKNLKQVADVAGPSCTEEEKAAKNECISGLVCSLATSPAAIASIMIPGGGNLLPKTSFKGCDMQDGCLTHAVNAIWEALWSTIKGLASLAYHSVGGILHDGALAGWNTIKGGINFFGASLSIDDASSYKVVQLAKTGSGMLADFIKDPGKAVKDFFKGIWGGINHWMMNDVFCKEWSGSPHISTCKTPASGWECLSCKQKLNGACTALGYVASTVAETLLTGGVGSILETTGITAKVGSALSKAVELGKLPLKAFDEAFPVLSEATGAGARLVGRGALNVGKGAVWTAKLPLKLLTGTAKGIYNILDKIPVVNLGTKAIRLAGEQGDRFLKFYVELNKNAFAVGQDLGGALGTRITSSAKVSRSLAATELALQDNTLASVSNAAQSSQVAAPIDNGAHYITYAGKDGPVQGKVISVGLDGKTLQVETEDHVVTTLTKKQLKTVKPLAADDTVKNSFMINTEPATSGEAKVIGEHDTKRTVLNSLGQPEVEFKTSAGQAVKGKVTGVTPDAHQLIVEGNDGKVYLVDRSIAKGNRRAEQLLNRLEAKPVTVPANTAALPSIQPPTGQVKWQDGAANSFRTAFDEGKLEGDARYILIKDRHGDLEYAKVYAVGVDGKSIEVTFPDGAQSVIDGYPLQTARPIPNLDDKIRNLFPDLKPALPDQAVAFGTHDVKRKLFSSLRTPEVEFVTASGQKIKGKIASITPETHQLIVEGKDGNVYLVDRGAIKANRKARKILSSLEVEPAAVPGAHNSGPVQTVTTAAGPESYLRIRDPNTGQSRLVSFVDGTYSENSSGVAHFKYRIKEPDGTVRVVTPDEVLSSESGPAARQAYDAQIQSGKLTRDPAAPPPPPQKPQIPLQTPPKEQSQGPQSKNITKRKTLNDIINHGALDDTNRYISYIPVKGAPPIHAEIMAVGQDGSLLCKSQLGQDFILKGGQLKQAMIDPWNPLSNPSIFERKLSDDAVASPDQVQNFKAKGNQ